MEYSNPDADATDVLMFSEDGPMAEEDPFVILEDRGQILRWREEDAALDDGGTGADTSSDEDEEGVGSDGIETECLHALPSVARSNLTRENRRAIWMDTPELPSNTMPSNPAPPEVSLSVCGRNSWLLDAENGNPRI
jgi:hypothetical protein